MGYDLDFGVPGQEIVSKLSSFDCTFITIGDSILSNPGLLVLTGREVLRTGSVPIAPLRCSSFRVFEYLLAQSFDTLHLGTLG